MPVGNESVMLFFDHSSPTWSSQHMRDASLRGPVPEHQADGHQCHGPREVPSHAVGEELFHSRLGRPLRPAAGRRGRHTAAAGCRPQGGHAAETVMPSIGRLGVEEEEEGDVGNDNGRGDRALCCRGFPLSLECATLKQERTSCVSCPF